MTKVDRKHFFEIRKRLITIFFFFNQGDTVPTENVDANGHP